MKRHIFIAISLLAWLWPTGVIALEPLSEAEAQDLARKYYSMKGEWAGKFFISRFLRSRFEPSGKDSVTVHFQYEWAFIQDQKHRGVDSRYFVYRHDGRDWSVAQMGQHKSGRL